jgi:hypothetical protein
MDDFDAYTKHKYEPYKAPQVPAQQEPVAWISDSPTKGNGKQLHWTKSEAWRWSSNITPLYTAPPKKELVGLTAYEIQEIHSKNQHWGNFACAIEAKLKEKNGGEYRNGATTERTKLNQENT